MKTAVEWLVNEIQTKHDKSFIEFYSAEIQQAKAMENKQYTRDEVHMLMCKAFEQGFKKTDTVEPKVECAWILTRYDSEPNKEIYGKDNS